MRKEEQIKFSFFDNRTYEYFKGYRRKSGKAVKSEANPVIKPELPHEFKRVHYYGSAVYDSKDQLYKTWYSTHYYGPALNESDPKAYSYLCYASSQDGIRFDKPELDVVPGTNIVMDNDQRVHGPTVIIDDLDPEPQHRFKCAMGPYTKGCAVHLYSSPDGIHWKPMFDGPALDVHSDCHIGFYRDPKTLHYRLSFRVAIPDRRVWVSESLDLKNWTRPVMSVEPDQYDPCETQFYGMQITPYGAYALGMINTYNTFDYTVFPQFHKMAGTMDIELAYSRDGFCWHRSMQGQKLVELGEEGSWDSGCVLPSSTLIYRPEEIVIFYAANSFDHSGPITIPYEEIDEERIGFATLRPDGFVYMDSAEEACELMTRPFAVERGGLFVNADASAEGGFLLAELTDTEGNALPGFSFEACVPFTGSSLKAEMTWRGNPDWTLAERAVIRVKLRSVNTKLYSFFFPNGTVDEPYWSFLEISCLNPLKYDIEPREDSPSMT